MSVKFQQNPYAFTWSVGHASLEPASCERKQARAEANAKNDNQAEESRRKRQREWYELLACRPREKSAS